MKLIAGAHLFTRAMLARNLRDNFTGRREASKRAGFFQKPNRQSSAEIASCLELTVLRELWAKANTPLTRSIFGPGPRLFQYAEGPSNPPFDPRIKCDKRKIFDGTEPDDAPRPTGQYSMMGSSPSMVRNRTSPAVQPLTLSRFWSMLKIRPAPIELPWWSSTGMPKAS